MNGPKNYINSDERIREHVCEALFHNPWVDASDIEVSVDHQVVFLRGEVLDRTQKRAAEDAADDIPGVDYVLNYLKLKKDRGLIGDMNIKANMI